MAATEHPDLSSCTTIDETADPGYFVSLMDKVEALSGVVQGRQAALAGLRLGPGHQVLELGCGTGEAALQMARVVAPGGAVTGIDLSEAMVNEARRRAEARGLKVAFEIGDAQQLRFARGSFDACRTERMLIHVPDAAAALAEMVRVLRPGGRVAVIDADIDGMTIDHPDRELTRTLIHRLTDSFCNGWIGRQLPRMFAEAGLADIAVEVFSVSFDRVMTDQIFAPHVEALASSSERTAEELAGWTGALDKADAAGALYCTMPFSVVTGVKP